MKIAVFGATGRTGVEIAGQAAEKGYEINALARNPEKLRIKSANWRNKIKLIKGDIYNIVDVERTIQSTDAVFFAIGSGLRQKPVCADGIRNVILAMKKYGVKRLIAESANGVKETRKGIGAEIAWLFIKDLMKDKEEMENLIRASDLDWTIVRPVNLTMGIKTGKYRHGENLKISIFPFPLISRADVADFMLSQIGNNQYLKKAPSISP